jgi:hypothetical protein
MRIIYLLLFAFSLSFQPLWGQQICRVDTTLEYEYITGTSVKELMRRTITSYNTFNQKSRVLREDWNAANNTYSKDRRTDYTYNSQGLVVETAISEYAAGVWYTIRKTFSVYNNAGLLQEIVRQRAMFTGSSLENESKVSYVYDNNSNLIETKFENWNSNNSSWRGRWKTVRTYLANNLLNQSEQFIWSNGNWGKSRLIDYVYDTQNRIIEELYRSFIINTNAYRSSMKNNYQYDANDNIIEELTQAIDQNSNWQNTVRITRAFTPNNDLLVQLIESYFANNWEGKDRIINTYDSQNNLTRSLEQEKEAWSSTWENKREEEFEYDQNNFLTAKEEYTSWNNSAGYFNNRTRLEYICTAINSNIGLAERAPNALSVFPNPLKKAADLTVQSPQEGPYVIYNGLGQVIKEGDLKKGENRLTSFSNQAGLYFLKTEYNTLQIQVN